MVCVPWTQRLLEKPARLLSRILDRLRKDSIFKRLDKSSLPVAVKEEVKRDAEFKAAALDDFAASLAECVAIEMNKRGVTSEHAHVVNVVMSGGELALAHYTLLERLDKLILAAQAAERAKAEAANEVKS